MRRLLIALAATAALTGCTAPDFMIAAGSPVSPGQPFFLLDTVSLINTDKTLIDHALTLSSGKDCSTIRAQNEGSYCVDRPPMAPPPPPRQLYCYRTLAAVNCYEQAAMTGNDHLIGTGYLPAPTR